MNIESNIQVGCVTWFRLQYPSFAKLLFSVPNGSSRNKLEAVRLKKEGVVAGVSDLILLVPRGNFHGLCIEMKRKGTYQSPEQKTFQKEVEKQGYLYKVCRSFDEFYELVTWYLSEHVFRCE